MIVETPIIKLTTELEGINLFMKRDDLLPFSFGGNKYRIAQELYDDMDEQRKNCMIGYGNARSNMCRVIANMSFARGQICHIISPADDDGKWQETNNSRVVKSCKAVIHTCTKQNVAATVKTVLNECEQEGLYPYYMYGDIYGNGNEAVPVRAYVKVYKEIKAQAYSMNVEFDYIFLAIGTGMTQAGLLAGKHIIGGNENIIGISVARKREQETQILQKYLNAYFKSIGIQSFEEDINVVDDYLFGGYGQYTTEILNTIRSMIRTNGVALDPTYTGKAFYGMIDYIKKNQIKDKNVLFIHTGGVPLFFDNIAQLL